MLNKVFPNIIVAIVFSAGFACLAHTVENKSVSIEESPVVGEFDSLVFALSYQKSFCEFHSDREECKSGTIASGMGLHGLWPNRDDDPQHKYGYCDISEAQVGKDWCSSQLEVKNKLTPTEFGVLSLAMPGAKSCLYNHEWYAHGSCSGLSVEDYLMRASSLTFQFWKLISTNQLISESAGKSLSREDFLQALEKDLGPAIRDSVTIECQRDRKAKKAYFSEIHISLDREKYMSFPARESLYLNKPTRKKDGTLVKNEGSCPAEGILISE